MSQRLGRFLGHSVAVFAVLVSTAGAVPQVPGPAQLESRLHALHVPFVENRGQYSGDVAFRATTFVGSFFVKRDGELVYHLSQDKEAHSGAVTVSEVLKGANAIWPRGTDPGGAKVNYFKGNDPARWQRSLPTYGSVSLGEVYDGIAVTLRGHSNNVEKLFHVDPGVDPGAIQVQVKGATSIEVTPDGQLALGTDLGALTLTRPVAFQEIEGSRRPVQVAYRVTGDTYTFALGAYDRSHPLVVDPMFSTYLGGSGLDYAYALKTHTISDAVDSQLFVYVTGYTTSNQDFPDLTGAQTEYGRGDGDAFVARLDQDLRVLETTYLGGRGDDSGWDLAIHPETDNVYVVGRTDSTDFPTAPNAGRGRGGDTDGFITCLTPDLSTIVQSRYLGGSDYEGAFGIDLHLRDEPDPDLLYVVGRTMSNDFPVSASAAQTAVGPNRSLGDAFVARLDPDDLSLQRATYMGGGSTDMALDVDVHDVSHEVFVVGETSYDGREGLWVGAFPWIAPDSFGGQKDTFVVRLSEDLTTVLHAAYLGGSGLEFGASLVVNHSLHEVYVVGGTSPYLDRTVSPPVYINDFPGVASGFQSELNGDQEAWVARLSSELAVLSATYLGGRYFERASDIILSDDNSPAFDVYVIGSSESDDFPGTDGGYCLRKTGDDVFVARLSSDLSTLEQATYVGGTGNDESHWHGLDLVNDPHTGGLYLFAAGNTSSSDFPGVLYTDTDSTAQPTYAGGLDGWVARLSPSLTRVGAADIELQPRSHDFGNQRFGIATPAMNARFENMGGDPLQVSSVFLTGAEQGDYALAFDSGDTPCGSVPFQVLSGELCTVGVIFTPSVDNDIRTAEVVVQSADTDEPELRILLQGYSGPDMTILTNDPYPEPTVEFPMTQVDSTPIRQYFTIQNDGYSDLIITGIQKTGIAPDTGADFSLHYEGAFTCPDPATGSFTLAPRANCSVAVDFAPTYAANQEALVVVSSNDLDENPILVHLIGPGVDELTANIWSSDIDFHDVPIDSSHSLPLTISNTGGEDLQMLTYTLSDTTNFSLDTDGGAIPCASLGDLLEPFTFCTLTATFHPQAASTFDETLTVTSNDPDAPSYEVHFAGRSSLDSDGDYVLDIEETGDANGDGTADANQAEVATVHSMERDHYVIFEAQDGAEMRDVLPNHSPTDAPLAGFEYPFGFYRFRVVLPPGDDGANIILTVRNADGTPADAIDTYIKYGPELGNPGYHYYDLGAAGGVVVNGEPYPSHVEIAGHIITLHLLDGGTGDSDDSDGDGQGEVNGAILDPGAPVLLVAAVDSDGDGVVDSLDNCPNTDNALQADADGDTLGDACDACVNDADNDADGDGVCGDVDNCPSAANDTQADTDGDGIGDACEPVPAGDGSGGGGGGCFLTEIQLLR